MIKYLKNILQHKISKVMGYFLYRFFFLILFQYDRFFFACNFAISPLQITVLLLQCSSKAAAMSFGHGTMAV